MLSIQASSESEELTSKTGKHSLLTRVGKIIIIFSLLLISIYTAMLGLLYRWGLTAATHNIVLYEAELYMRAYAQKSCTPLPNTQSFKGFLGRETVSENINHVFPQDMWEIWPKGNDGILYRYQRNELSETHYHLLINDLPGTDKKFILFYEITVSDETKAKVWKKFKLLSILGGVVVIGLLFFFRYYMRSAISPLGSLSAWMNKIEDENSPKELPKDINNDEIGQLAHELHSALVRIQDTTAREKQFLRNASHELRTPIAIIRNAMDLLEYKRSVGDKDIDQVLGRIRRAGDTMKSVTEAILWLALDGYNAPAKEITLLATVAEEVIEENQEIYKNKKITFNTHIENSIEIEIEPVLLRIALDNMLRNAFQHCGDDGEITLNCLSVDRIEIVNSTPTYEKSGVHFSETETAMQAGGFGLGLSLVAKIAEKQGWNFHFSLQDDCAISRLHFSNGVSSE